MKIFILGAQPFTSNLLNISDLGSPLQIPYLGRPLLNFFLTSFPSAQLTFVINEKANFTKRMIEGFSKRQGIEILEVPTGPDSISGPADSLRLALNKTSNSEEDVLVMYADNVVDHLEIEKAIEGQNLEGIDGIAFTTEYQDSIRYSSFEISSDHLINRFYNKDVELHGAIQSRTDIGVYYFKSMTLLKAIMQKSISSQIAECFVDSFQFVSVDLKSWSDLGHWDLLTNPKQIGESRPFNSIQFDSNGGLIKSSTNFEKIRNEIAFFNAIPSTYAFDFPRVKALGDQDHAYSIEYWPLKSLSEFIVFWGLTTEKTKEFLHIINSRLLSYKDYEGAKGHIDTRELAKFHEKKLRRGMACESEQVQALLSLESIYINGEKFVGYPSLISEIYQFISNKSSNPIIGFLHGDLCFSNILISPEERVVKFIDPRGSFLDSVNIGDLKYDLAKLFQGLAGYYDFIKSGHYVISQNSLNSWNLKILVPKKFHQNINAFEEILLIGFEEIDRSDLYYWVAINYLSLLPFHDDTPQDQAVFLLVSLLIMNLGNCNLVVELV